MHATASSNRPREGNYVPGNVRGSVRNGRAVFDRGNGRIRIGRVRRVYARRGCDVSPSKRRGRIVIKRPKPFSNPLPDSYSRHAETPPYWFVDPSVRPHADLTLFQSGEPKVHVSETNRIICPIRIMIGRASRSTSHSVRLGHPGGTTQCQLEESSTARVPIGRPTASPSSVGGSHALHEQCNQRLACVSKLLASRNPGVDSEETRHNDDRDLLR